MDPTATLKLIARPMIPEFVLAARRRYLAGRAWRARDYAPPSPPHVKRRVLARNGWPGATWVETGTFEGETSRFLSRHAPAVYTIEPDDALYRAAARRLAGAGIEVIHGSSESALPVLLPRLCGDVNFWLDGHWSGGPTHRGACDTPIRSELDCISAHRERLGRLAVMIDDVRCFDPSLPACSAYPPLERLIEWANGHRLKWHIEHDIFVARG